MDSPYPASVRWAWIAALVEGEGSIYVSKKTTHVAIHLNSTDEDVIRRLAEWSGFGKIYGPTMPIGARKPVWHWSIGKHQDCARFLLGIAPLLAERRRARVLEAAEKLQRHPGILRAICRNGHPKENLYDHPKGYRQCRECKREGDRRRRARG